MTGRSIDPGVPSARYGTQGVPDGNGGSVSLELPGWVADAFNSIGLPWPGIDEDQLRAWAQDLRQYATATDALSSHSKAVSSFGTLRTGREGRR